METEWGDDVDVLEVEGDDVRPACVVELARCGPSGSCETKDTRLIRVC